MDSGFNGPDFAAWVQTQHPKLVVEVVQRLAEVPGFQVLPKRWVVERTFAWASINRRLARDFEGAAATARAFFQIAMIKLMARRIARYHDF